jgi:MFS family permease
VPLIRGIFFLGQVLGSIVFAPFGDVIGRKQMLFGFIFAAGLANTVTALLLLPGPPIEIGLEQAPFFS